MAGTNVRVSAEELQAAMSNFETRKNDFQEVINGIKSILWDLEGTWTGVAEQAYESQARDLMNNMQVIMQSMDGAKGKMQLVLNSYMELEEDRVGGFNALDEGTPDYVS